MGTAMLPEIGAAAASSGAAVVGGASTLASAGYGGYKAVKAGIHLAAHVRHHHERKEQPGFDIPPAEYAEDF